MKTKEKEWDCVKFQREQRDRLSAMFVKMTQEDRRAYFKELDRKYTMNPSR